MPTIVTYDLQQKQQNSDDYYKRIEQLAETISKQLTLHFQKELEDFEEYIRDQQTGRYAAEKNMDSNCSCLVFTKVCTNQLHNN